MNIAFYLAHPSQYYVFRNIIKKLNRNQHNTLVLIKSKDILENLLISDEIPYTNIFPAEKKQGFFNLVTSVTKRNQILIKELKRNQIELLVSCASDSCQASFILGLPSIVLNDDDAQIIKKSALFGWPFSSIILAPKSCDMGFWAKKTYFYNGFQKLCYLHPNYFSPQKKVLDKYAISEDSFFIIRSVSLSAHHDKNIRGLNNQIVERLIELLSPYGRVYISSERELPLNLRPYKLEINPLDMHHLLFYAKMLIGDSQSMAHEAALLGTPSFRYNDFAGRIGVLNELEQKHNLTFGIKPDSPEILIDKVKYMLENYNKEKFKQSAIKMISEMIDVTKFLTWLIENYPNSAYILKDNPDYQYNFMRVNTANPNK